MWLGVFRRRGLKEIIVLLLNCFAFDISRALKNEVGTYLFINIKLCTQYIKKTITKSKTKYKKRPIKIGISVVVKRKLYVKQTISNWML